MVNNMVRRSFFSSRILLFQLQHLRVLPPKTCIKSIPVASHPISRQFCDGTEVTGSYKEPVTQASHDEDVTDEKLDEILFTMEKSPRSGRKICNVYVDNLCNAGNLSAALRLVQALHDRNIILSLNAYDRLLAVAAAKCEIDVLCQVFKDMIFYLECVPSASFLTLARAFLKISDHALLLRLIKDVSKLEVPRSTVVLNRIIFAFSECRQFDKAITIFEQMKDLKCKPDLVTYNTVLDLLGRAGRIDEMLCQFASIKESGIKPDFISYNTLLNQLRKVGRLDLSLVYFKEMNESGIEADLLTYTALIRSFCQSGNIEEALRLFNDMKMRQVRPSIYIYRSLVDGLNKMGNVELAAAFSQEMNASLPDLAGPKDFKRKGR
ncbi:hypothetical protein Tsubulata_008848 [Turnera subulata]|uniref:Pentacotripeptide-repeat region of PRORP domain-containing protein n=1 Tax=Turnera subulata TaxID=218843 RepID=A0A9Q0F586_9ROSI|nr:hypothetical protein Tsubulata_008848 [Turnera subulata]